MKYLFKVSKFLVTGIIFIFLATVNILGQNSKELDVKKQSNIQQLNYSRSLLEKTAQSKKSSLNELNLIQHDIGLRTEIVGNISEELFYLKNDIEANNLEITKIENRINLIKKEYAQLIKGASRNLDNDYALMYIFSSEDFNQAYQRIKYLKYLTRYRMELVQSLRIEEEGLLNKNLELNKNKKRNEELLMERKGELSLLDRDRKKNLSLIKSLQSKETELKKDIQNRERIQTEIEKEIRRIIEEEEAKVRAAKKSDFLTPEEKILSNDFSKNVGRLPWPSAQGVLIGKYGEQNHPVLKGIKIRSNGVDISTAEGEKVRSVFDGEVTKVIAILGANNTVIIKHGDYRTVYQNLIDVSVRAGDKVKMKTLIGTVFTDQDNISRFHFEVWKDKETLNPELWLSK